MSVFSIVSYVAGKYQGVKVEARGRLPFQLGIRVARVTICPAVSDVLCEE